MTMKWCLWFIVLLISFLGFILVTAVEETVVFSKTFFVEPGGEKNVVEGKEDGLTCKFSYICQGGTNEEWEMTIDKEKDGDYVCIVERPQYHPPSYLFFQEFQLKVTGGKIKEGHIYTKNTDTAGAESEYSVKKQTIKHTEDFNNSLNRVRAVIGRKKHQEL